MGAAASSVDDSRTCCCQSMQLEERRALLDSEPYDENNHEGSESLVELPHAVIQFSTEIFFASEDEGTVMVDVVRLGDASGRASFSYCTKDGSGKAGMKYRAQSGTLSFEPEQTMVSMNFELCQNDTWDSTLEFQVQILGVKGAHRGRYLHNCTVRIIDNDIFPTNAFQGRPLDASDIELISGPVLFLEFVRMNLTDNFIRRRFLLRVCLDQLGNLHFLLSLYLQLYLVDVVLDFEVSDGGDGGDGSEHHERTVEKRLDGAAEERRLNGAADEEAFEIGLLVPGSRYYTAVAVAFLYVAPLAINHGVDILNNSMCLAGHVRKSLQSNLLRKFLNYREDIRDALSYADLTMAVTRDITEVVDMGFIKLFQVHRICGKFGLALCFVLTENSNAVVPMMILPVILAVFLMCREQTLTHVIEATADAQNLVVRGVNDTISNYRLIADFNLRAMACNTFEFAVDIFNEAAKLSVHVGINNAYMAPWLTNALIGAWIIYGTSQVQSGAMTLGGFLGTINVFKEIGKELQEIYVEAMEIQKTFGPLKRLTFFLNQPTDLSVRMFLNRERRRVGKLRVAERREAASHESSGLNGFMDKFPVDLVCIEVINVTFKYPGRPATLRDFSIKFDQGCIYSFVGHKHQGKSTILKLVGQVLMPEPKNGEVCGNGEVFIPPHLRVIHVGRECLILDKSFMRNIVFDQPLERVGGWARVVAICQRCGFSEYLMRILMDERANGHGQAQEQEEAHLTAGVSAHVWSRTLAYSDFARLNLVRVLLMNPECAVMHLPFVSFGDHEAEEMLLLLRQHVDERGLELPEDTRCIRRLRTVFFSSVALARCKGADVVYSVDNNQLTPIAEHGKKTVANCDL